MATVKQIEGILKQNNAANNTVLKKEIRNGLKEELTAFKEDIKEMVTSSLKEASQRIDQLEAKVQEKEMEIESLKAEIRKTKEQTLNIQFEAKKKNLLLFKIKENEVPLNVRVATIIRESVDANFTESDIDSVYRVGVRGNTPRPIKVELTKASKRCLILANKKKLQDRNIGIAEDLPKDISVKRKTLYKLADVLRQNGRKVVFRREKFLVDGSEWSEDRIEHEKIVLLTSARSDSDVTAAESYPRSNMELNLPPTPEGAHSLASMQPSNPFSSRNKNRNNPYSSTRNQ